MSLPQLRLSNPEENRSRTGFSILGSMNDEFAAVLSPGVRHFLGELHRTFDRRRSELLEARAVRQRERDSGRLPDFEEETVDVRESDWQVAPIPPDLTDRRVEITGPVDRKMIINALNSGANVFMADFEDSTAPTWNNVMQGQVNLRDAVLRAIDFTDPRGKEYQLNDETATLFVRPRGWHLDERHLKVDGRPLSGALFDFGVFFYHNAHPLIASGSGPYFYLPKLESYHEARLWNDVFNFSQDYLGIPRGTIRATVLIETIPAAFQMHEILWELRQHSAGLNCGRWDYIFSFIKQFRNLPEFVLPDRGSVTMDRAFLDAYVQLLIQTCHRRGIHAMGGMAAQIPIKDNPVANEKALEKVRQDKLREVRAGHDGTWVAHPGLVAVAREVFDEFMDGPNQIHRTRDDVNVTATDLLSVPEGQITEQGLRHNLDVGIQYLESWLRGNGCVPIYHLMEDAATAEISRSQVWQWVRHRKQLEDGRTISTDLVKQAILEQMEGIRAVKGPLEFARGRYSQAARLFERMITSPQLDDWLTILAYRHI